MNEIETTLVGNLTTDPELRFTPNGQAVANFTIAVSHRKFDKQQGKSVEASTTFARCAVWGTAAENVAESLVKGTRVIAHGEFRQRDYEHQGEKRSSMDFTCEAVGPDLRWATAKVTKADRSAGGNSGGWQQQPVVQSDPWATSGSATGGGADDYSNPPF